MKCRMPDEKSKLVYSTDKTVSRKEKPDETPLQTSAPAAQQKVTVRLDRKSRGGKTVTVIEGLQMPGNKLEELLRRLKAKLGTGGTIRDTSLEIQGDHRDAVLSTLKNIGFAPKRSGG
ncbi:MAG: translation initiation factor [Nitrospirae bacterium]|nr:translation initiation factor [Nitrospirota bacterium]